ncbi:MAG: ABC transporter permease subunit [Lachnospiraceae bacterium]|nr:ABC transporter permease subunit [Lachnospiraceae bacterium]
MMQDNLRINDNDNVAVALKTLPLGYNVTGDGGAFSVRTLDIIPAGHKVALTDIAKGDKVIKYGHSIGYAICDIKAGSHVHIPKELDEAATIDGCSKYTIYSHIILPLLKPAIVTTVIIQFYWKWDDYMGPLLYLSKPSSYTVSLAIKMFADAASTTDYGAMFAMSTLSLLPVFLIFLFFNKYLVEGIGTSGLKG